MTVKSVRKFVVAAAAALGVLGAGMADGTVDANEWIGVCLAFLGAIGVYTVPNEDPNDV